MADVIRLKNYKTYLSDGKSSVSYGMDGGRVVVAVILGYEPARIKTEKDWLDVDDVILRMAEHIKHEHTKKAKAAKRKLP